MDVARKPRVRMSSVLKLLGLSGLLLLSIPIVDNALMFLRSYRAASAATAFLHKLDPSLQLREERVFLDADSASVYYRIDQHPTIDEASVSLDAKGAATGSFHYIGEK